jgi:arginase family enzyme
LDEEIKRISPQNMKVFEADDIQNMMDKLIEHAHKDDVFKTLPYILTSVDPDYFDQGTI